jgi:chromate transporter
VHHWTTAAGFIDLFAISKAAPGPSSSLLATLVGYRVAGVPGSVVTTLSLFLPSSLLVYAVARLWRRHEEAPWRGAVERGLTPIAAGLVLGGAATILRSAEGGALAWIVAAGSLAAMRWLRIDSLLLLAAGAVIFTLAGLWR